MFKRVQESFTRGWERIRWFASVLSERLNLEVAIVKLLYQSDRLAKQRDELLKAIGRRVYELRGQDRNVLKDSGIVEALAGIERLEADIGEMKKKASDISRVTD